MKKIISTILATLILVSVIPMSIFSVSAASNVVPKGAKQFNGHTYYVFKSKTSWTKAKAYCESKGGHLVTITSAKENKFVSSLIDKANLKNCWLGGHDSSTEGKWQWVTGEKFKYTSWQYSQPDNSTLYVASGEDYLQTYTYSDSWNDAVNSPNTNHSTSPQGYVCEWDMTKSKASGIRINKASTFVYYKASTTLKLINTTKKASWSTSNKKIATVNSNGKVTGVGTGTCTITAKIGTKKYNCKVTVKDRNVAATSTFKVYGGGYFLKGVSSAQATFKLKSYNANKVTVYIKNSTGTTVYTKKYTNLVKNKNYSFIWNGKKSNGSYAPADSYRVVIKIGSKNSYSPYLAFKTTNDFSGGNGSKAKPFLVTTTTQFKKIIKYPYAYFKQTKDLDFDYTAVSGLFTTDKPFNGVYDGGNKTISNITAKDALFTVLGKSGTIKNLKLKNCSVLGTNKTSVFVKTNYGKITNCNINGAIAATTDKHTYIGLMVYENYGTITNCVTSGQVSSNEIDYGHAYAGGMVAFNQSEGKILSSVSNVNVTAHSNSDSNYYDCAGGIAAENSGLINDCEATGTINARTTGGITAINKGQIISSYYTGSSTVNIAGENSGIIS